MKPPARPATPRSPALPEEAAGGSTTGARPTAWWVERLLRPAMIAAMTACLAVPFVLALETVLTGWSGTYFLVVAFAASLEGVLFERVLRRERITGEQYIASRLAEAIVLLIVLKLTSYSALGWDLFRSELLRWPPDPLLWLRPYDLVTGLFLLMLWAPALQVGRLLIDLDEEPPPPPDRTSTAHSLWQTQPRLERDRQTALDRLGELFLMGGVALLAGLGLLFIVSIPRSAEVTGILALMLYFTLGVGLLSQARFAIARAAWQSQGIPVQPGIGRRWLVWALLFIAGVVAVSLVLPVQYATGPLAALRSAALVLFAGLGYLAQWLLFLLALPLLLFAPSDTSRPPPSAPALPTLGAGGEAAATSAQPWLQTLGAAALWALLIGVLLFSVVRFVRDRLRRAAARPAGPDEAEQAARTPLGRLRAWLRALWQRLRGWQEQVQERVAERRGRRPAPGISPPGRFVSLRRLAPGELVRYFYLSVARRAGQAGQPRRAGQTPYEYRADLERRFPDLETDLEGLTEAFVRARYGAGAVEPAQVEAVKPLWQRLKAALRGRRAGATAPGDGGGGRH